jgi:tetratricopeptide (TPR) repeat protein
LRALIPERRQLLLRNSRRFNSWGLFELLIQRATEETFTDPRHAEELLLLALEISPHLSRSFYGREVIEDMQARTWGYIANARRARWEFQASEEAFEEAFVHLRRGTEDPMERAVLFDLQASLRKVQQRFDESLQLLRRAISVFRRVGEVHRVNGAIVNASGAYFSMGNPEQAISLLYQSLKQIDPTSQPRVALCAFNNLANSLGTAGRFMEAQRVLLRARPLYQRFPEPRVQSRRLWIEAKIAYGLGRHEAEELLQEAQDVFRSANTAYDVDLILRELSSLRRARE